MKNELIKYIKELKPEQVNKLVKYIPEMKTLIESEIREEKAA